MDVRPKGLVDGVDEAERESKRSRRRWWRRVNGSCVCVFLCTDGRLLLARFVADELNVEFVGVN